MWDTIWNFIVNNWVYFAIGGSVVVILLLLLIVGLSVQHSRKKKAKKEALAQKKSQQMEAVKASEDVQPLQQENKDKLQEQPSSEQLQPQQPEQVQGATKEASENKNKADESYRHYLLERLRELHDKNIHNEERTEYTPYNGSPYSEVVEPEYNTEEVQSKGFEDLQERIHRGKTELDRELKEIEALKSKALENDENNELQRMQTQIDLLTSYLRRKEEERIELLKDVMNDEDFSKQLSDREYLNALEQSVKSTPQPTESIQSAPVQEPQPVALERKEEPLEDEDDEEEFKGEGVLININPKYTLQEALNMLSPKQRSYFKKLRAYADAKNGAVVKESAHYVVVGVGNSPYVKLSVKRNTTVASFRLENEEIWDLRYRKKNKTVKPKETPIKVLTDQDFDVAKQLIDARVEQVAREKEYKRNLRNEKRRKQK